MSFDVKFGTTVEGLRYIDKLLADSHEVETAHTLAETVSVLEEAWKMILEKHLGHLESEEVQENLSKSLREHGLLERLSELCSRVYEKCVEIGYAGYGLEPPANVLRQIGRACDAAVKRGHRLSKPAIIDIEMS